MPCRPPPGDLITGLLYVQATDRGPELPVTFHASTLIGAEQIRPPVKSLSASVPHAVLLLPKIKVKDGRGSLRSKEPSHHITVLRTIVPLIRTRCVRVCQWV